MFKQIQIFFRRRRAKKEAKILAVLAVYGELTCLGIAEALDIEFRWHSSFAALYPLLHGLEKEGLVSSRWGEEQVPIRGGLRRRYYRLVKFP